jgi:Immunity protein 53
MSPDSQTSTLIEKLQRWYKSECNGDWEHQYSISIETIDNPGWSVKIDLSETEWERVEIERNLMDYGDDNWISWEVSAKQFKGYGSIGNLASILEKFFETIDSKNAVELGPE